MHYWRFLDYWSEGNDRKNLIEEWYRNEGEELQAAFDTALNELAGTEDWRDLGWFKVLTGKHTGLCEIKIDIPENPVVPGRKPPATHYRPVGFIKREPGEFISGEFVLLLGCKKSGRSYEPPNAFDLALDLKRKFQEEGRGRIHAHSF
ncbi:MAG TPA: hypothetical protein VMV34_06215 [Terriglobia bacterium]|nr:hypothetical protein [Terriglobia bacterium]